MGIQVPNLVEGKRQPVPGTYIAASGLREGEQLQLRILRDRLGSAAQTLQHVGVQLGRRRMDDAGRGQLPHLEPRAMYDAAGAEMDLAGQNGKLEMVIARQAAEQANEPD